ncbi:MAG: hypothetical protein ACRDVC_05330 [Acidimicrobiales bacterium]
MAKASTGFFPRTVAIGLYVFLGATAKEMVMVATHDDAALMVQLMRWGTEMNLDEAYRVIFSMTSIQILRR